MINKLPNMNSETFVTNQRAIDNDKINNFQ